ncbi:MAG: hypothetical protein CRU78_05070 [Candidatus Accumulibacter phosphatis]|uniref:Uncharacterized protein n=1 Tax=Candidatus Accumulibacter phosphatis TaxID=327160 RepID=A0A6A7RRJ2_9PROT|nr:hypothetical protein [Candidatus Accumulibacter phosphatis]
MLEMDCNIGRILDVIREVAADTIVVRSRPQTIQAHEALASIVKHVRRICQVAAGDFISETPSQ